ncbi:MAG: xanthine dehydrogenase small subunit [Pseudomonadota bacterium]
MKYRKSIRFLLNDQAVHMDDVAASQTLLDYLRLNARLTGTKEGCAEGDCGACTVLVGRLGNEGMNYQPVNACIRFLASVDGCHVVTVEHLSSAGEALHPVQQAMVDFHASQCGFCTPGIVMALYALWMTCRSPTVADIEKALQGNLCRCTGYEPIIKAAEAMGRYEMQRPDPLHQSRERVLRQLQEWQDGTRVVAGPDDDLAILPSSLNDFAACLVENPEATVIAGATDVGLWVTKFLRPISPAIFTDHLTELRHIAVDSDCLSLGAGVSYSDCESQLAAHYPHLTEYWDRIAGWQVRNMGTIGGNIANGSPIGDTPPVLIALGASLVLRRGESRRELPLDRFFVDYGKQDLRKDEFVESIRIPLSGTGQRNAAYKISKRRDEDITAVAMGISVTVQDDLITSCRIALGGMAATPKRATSCEDALTGAAWSEASFEKAADVLRHDFTPVTDWRASSEYRMLGAQNLLRRFFLEQDASTQGFVRLNEVRALRAAE